MNNLFSRKVPSVIFRRSSQTIIITLMAMFALVFMWIYKPFDIFNNLRFDEGIPDLGMTADNSFYFVCFLLVLLGVVSVSVSRIIMSRYNQRHRLIFYGYILWCFLEFAVFALLVSLLATLTLHRGEFISIFLKVAPKTFCILSIPYAFSIVCTMLVERIQQFNKLRRQIENDEIAQMKTYVLFHDDKGLKLSIKREDLLLIESADNYVCVWYQNNNTIKKEMIRNTMKRLVDELSDSEIRRCHRSYMVNLDRVNVFRREKDGIFVAFGIDGVPDIPISKTYAKNITSWLMK